ncbi:hypothetical protein BC830DRAFT_1175681 [Chytriomyces sp. MP71]|nr:hypothetical protein BC830DRAFT_1175681 [Chytriomyces sp. MP71]
MITWQTNSLDPVHQDRPNVKPDEQKQNLLGLNTFFAPTDAAFSAALQNDARFGDSTTDQVLVYHAVSGTVFARNGFSGTAFLESLNGDEIKASGSSEQGIALSTPLNAPPSVCFSLSHPSCPFSLHSTEFVQAGTSQLKKSEAKEMVTVKERNVLVMGAGNKGPAMVTTAKNGVVVHLVKTAGDETNAMEGKGNGGADAIGATNAGGKAGVAEGATSYGSLVQVLSENNANTLLQLVKSDTAVLDALIAFQGTLFAPSDAAFAAVAPR